jgi:beta-phosphoglucomutase-like phosphatase (HAD superfamily)
MRIVAAIFDLRGMADGVVEFMDLLKENGISISLATSSNWEITDKILEHLGLTNYFESITTGEEVLNSKPAPDIFLLAAEKLGVDPMDCLVIEDSVSGIIAAKDAGMKVIAISSEDNEEDLENADLVVESFSAITLKAIDALALD